MGCNCNGVPPSASSCGGRPARELREAGVAEALAAEKDSAVQVLVDAARKTAESTELREACFKDEIAEEKRRAEQAAASAADVAAAMQATLDEAR